MLKAAARREFDLLAAWSVDRLGRSLQDLIATLNELHAAGVDLFLHQQALDTTTPAGRAMFGMLGVFSEFERSIIQERVKAGLARAKANGKRLGRKPVPPRVVGFRPPPPGCRRQPTASRQDLWRVAGDGGED